MVKVTILYQGQHVEISGTNLQIERNDFGQQLVSSNKDSLKTIATAPLNAIIFDTSKGKIISGSPLDFLKKMQGENFAQKEKIS